MVSRSGVEAAARDGDALPAGEQANEGVLFGGDDFAAEAGEGLATDLLEHLWVAPFAVCAFGAELSLEQLAIGVKATEDGLDLCGREAEAGGDVGGGEGTVGAGVAAEEFEERTVGGFEEDARRGRAAAARQRRRDNARRIPRG